MIKSHVLVAVFGGMFAFAQLPSPADEKPIDKEILRRILRPAEKNPLIDRLESEDHSERGLAYVDLRKQHRRMVADLIAIADKPKNEYPFKDSRDYAVRLLTELRCREAVPVLVRHVDYYQPRPESFTAGYKGYSCAKALAAIGPESVKGIYDHLGGPVTSARYRERLDLSRGPSRDPVSDKAVELFARLLHDLLWTEENSPEDVVNTVKRRRDRSLYPDGFDRVLAKMEELSDRYRRRKIN